MVDTLTCSAAWAPSTAACASTSEDCGEDCAVATLGGGPDVAAVSGAGGVEADATCAAAPEKALMACWIPAVPAAIELIPIGRVIGIDPANLSGFRSASWPALACRGMQPLRPRPHRARWPLLAAVLVLAVTACGYSPGSAAALLDDLEDAGAAVCTERREPVPDVMTCVDPVNGDLTVGLTDDPAGALRRTRATAGGPWVVGRNWVVISYDDDLDRLREIRDLIGHGELYLDVDEVPVQVD